MSDQNILNRKEKAMEYFKNGSNCAQAVLLAYMDLLDVDEASLLKLASSFGGGMGRLREVCGAVSGMFMVAGLLKGTDDYKDLDAKAKHYGLIQELAAEFRNEKGSIVCRELLEIGEKTQSPVPEKRDDKYYKKRPCVEIVGAAAEIIGNRIFDN